jgi:hypothetical protein
MPIAAVIGAALGWLYVALGQGEVPQRGREVSTAATFLVGLSGALLISVLAAWRWDRWQWLRVSSAVSIALAAIGLTAGLSRAVIAETLIVLLAVGVLSVGGLIASQDRSSTTATN